VSAGRVYVSVAELADRTGWSERTIWRLVSLGTLKQGVHYFRPLGRTVKFKWTAVELFIEGNPAKTEPASAPPPRRSRGTKIDIGTAIKELERGLLD
jgi:predicted DNA-binding transcriptional regulator AlpA